MFKTLSQCLQDPKERDRLLAVLNEPESLKVREEYIKILSPSDPRTLAIQLDIHLSHSPPPKEAHPSVQRLLSIIPTLCPQWWALVRIDHPVHNCHRGESEDPVLRFAYRCPLSWSWLDQTEEPNARYCTQCKHSVYHCASVEEAEERAKQGQCIAVSKATLHPLSQELTQMMVGRPDPIQLWGKRIFSAQ